MEKKINLNEMPFTIYVMKYILFCNSLLFQYNIQCINMSVSLSRKSMCFSSKEHNWKKQLYDWMQSSKCQWSDGRRGTMSDGGVCQVWSEGTMADGKRVLQGLMGVPYLMGIPGPIGGHTRLMGSEYHTQFTAGASAISSLD